MKKKTEKANTFSETNYERRRCVVSWWNTVERLVEQKLEEPLADRTWSPFSRFCSINPSIIYSYWGKISSNTTQRLKEFVDNRNCIFYFFISCCSHNIVAQFYSFINNIFFLFSQSISTIPEKEKAGKFLLVFIVSFSVEIFG